MPIKESAKKALRGSLNKRGFNIARKTAMKTAVKDVKKLVLEKSTDEAKKLMSAAYKAIDKAAKKGVIKKNTAARKKSRLSAMIKKASGK
jgi:small subunit ribosomal protein S20